MRRSYRRPHDLRRRLSRRRDSSPLLATRPRELLKDARRAVCARCGQTTDGLVIYSAVVPAQSNAACRRASMAQPAARVSGTIRDPNGAIVPGVTVALFDLRRSAAVQTTVSGRDGSFTLSSIRPGPYRLRLTLSGFEPWEHDCRRGHDDARRRRGFIGIAFPQTSARPGDNSGRGDHAAPVRNAARSC